MSKINLTKRRDWRFVLCTDEEVVKYALKGKNVLAHTVKAENMPPFLTSREEDIVIAAGRKIYTKINPNRYRTPHARQSRRETKYNSEDILRNGARKYLLYTAKQHITEKIFYWLKIHNASIHVNIKKSEEFTPPNFLFVTVEVHIQRRRYKGKTYVFDIVFSKDLKRMELVSGDRGLFEKMMKPRDWMLLPNGKIECVGSAPSMPSYAEFMAFNRYYVSLRHRYPSHCDYLHSMYSVAGTPYTKMANKIYGLFAYPITRRSLTVRGIIYNLGLLQGVFDVGGNRIQAKFHGPHKIEVKLLERETRKST